MKKHVGISLLVLFPVLFIMVPLLLYAVLLMGWPPVIGNLIAAGAMRNYAAEAHPEWEAKSAWAGYNLVDDDYGLDFTYGELHYDRDNGLWLVRDERRKDALRSELGIGWRLKEGGELPDYVRWNAGWRPGDARRLISAFVWTAPANRATLSPRRRPCGRLWRTTPWRSITEWPRRRQWTAFPSTTPTTR